MLDAPFKRKEVALIFGVDPLTIRAWEKKKIITPTFYAGKHPRYSVEEIERVAAIKPTYKTKTTGNE